MKTFTVTETNKQEVLEQIEKETDGFKRIAETFGYNIVYPFVRENGDLELQAAGNGKYEYSPKIYISNKDIFRKQEEMKVKIQTTSYGSLDAEEFEKFLEAQHQARNFAVQIKDFYEAGYFPKVIFEK